MNAQRLRPLGVGDIFDEGFDLYKRNFAFLLLATVALVVPLDIGLAALSPRLLPAVFSLLDLTSQSDAFGLWLVTVLTKTALYLPLYLVALGPVMLSASAKYLDQNITVEAAFRVCGRRLPGLLMLGLFAGIILALSLLPCGLLWLPAATLLLFALPALLVEGLRPVGAMRRSAALGGGYGLRTFGCLLLLGATLFTVGLGLRLPLAYLVDTVLNIAPGAAAFYSGVDSGGAGGTAQQQAVALLSGGLAHLLLLPFAACVVTVLYYDLRIRKEGVDIELLALDLGYPPLSALGPFLPPVPTFQMRLGLPPGRPPAAMPPGGGPPK